MADETICAVDVGNSALKGGMFHGSELSETFRISLLEGEDPAVDALLGRLTSGAVDRLGVSSVVPSIGRTIEDATSAIDVDVFVLEYTSTLPFEIRYETPETLGVDRIAAAAGAWQGFGGTGEKPIVIVDAGTAVTADVLAKGVLLGGVILPGPELQKRALRAGTAQLPVVELHWPTRVISRTTRESISTGIMYGFVDAVRGLLVRIVDELGEQPHIIVTGGWGKLLSEKIEMIGLYDADLVIRGVAAVMQLNRPSR